MKRGVAKQQDHFVKQWLESRHRFCSRTIPRQKLEESKSGPTMIDHNGTSDRDAWSGATPCLQRSLCGGSRPDTFEVQREFRDNVLG
jgi:hypothetical protein